MFKIFNSTSGSDKLFLKWFKHWQFFLVPKVDFGITLKVSDLALKGLILIPERCCASCLLSCCWSLYFCTCLQQNQVKGREYTPLFEKIYKAQRLSSPRIFRVQLLHANLCDYVHYLFKMVVYGHITGK